MALTLAALISGGGLFYFAAIHLTGVQNLRAIGTMLLKGGKA